jgi:thiosulfate/3-mercaptopyruvate sulfurtransferase
MNCNEDGTFKSAKELEKLYLRELKMKRRSPTIAYCRIGERSSLTWFVLKYLLGFGNVKNYDGSWLEWGNCVGGADCEGCRPRRCRCSDVRRSARLLMVSLLIRRPSAHCHPTA